jgi:hypothetical protein
MTMIFVQAAGSSLSSTLESVIVAVVQVVATILAALVMDKLGESTLLLIAPVYQSFKSGSVVPEYDLDKKIKVLF